MLNLSSIKPFPFFPRDPRDPRGSFCSTPDWSLLTRRLAYACHRFLSLRERDIPVDASDRNVRAARPDAGSVAAVAFLVFALLEVRQIGFDSTVVAARLDVRVDIADEAQICVAVDLGYVNPASCRELGDGSVNLAVDVSE